MRLQDILELLYIETKRTPIVPVRSMVFGLLSVQRSYQHFTVCAFRLSTITTLKKLG